MSKLKYGEFSFPKPTARPTVSGYARGGSTSSAPKSKGQAKVAKVMGEFKRGDLHSGSAKGPIVKNPKQAMAIALSEKKAAGYKGGGDVKLVGMKREPEAIVKKEVALLKKAGAPAKIIKHEKREMTLPSAMKKGGKAKYEEGGFEPPSDNVFRERDGKYFHNNQEVSREDFNKRREAVDRRMQQLRGPDRRGMSLRDRARAAMGDLDAETEDSFEMIRKREQRPTQRGDRDAYADGGQVRKMVGESAKMKGVKPVKPVRGGSGQMTDRERMMMERSRSGGQMTDRERMMMEQARGERMDRQMREAEMQHYQRERAENEADRRSAQDALMYIPRKIGEGARSAYDAVMDSNFLKGARNYGRSYQEGLGMTPSTPYEKKRGGAVHEDVAMDKKVVSKAVHKHEAAMHPGKPMTKLKKGGGVQKYADGGIADYVAAPPPPTQSSMQTGMPQGAAPSSQVPSWASTMQQQQMQQNAPAAPSEMARLAQAYATQRNASPAAGRLPPPPVSPAQQRGQMPAYAQQALTRPGVQINNQVPNPRFRGIPVQTLQRNRPAPAQAAPATAAQRNTSGLGFKKGGTTKKGVPVHSRTPKC